MPLPIHILFEIKDEPWGGGNQFLKALRAYFRSRSLYAESAADAGVVLFNSHHHLDRVAALKRAHPDKVFLHRCDGPIRVVRGSGWEIDRAIFRHNARIADGTVFQSEWSRAQAAREGMPRNRFEAVIHNAPDPGIFHPAAGPRSEASGKVRVLAMSWSTNALKGFDVYSHLDRNLDFGRYEMTFIGNAPEPFRNIRMVPPLPSQGVAEELRNHDLFLSASHLEACSNAIVEALNCRVPALVRDNSSQPELVRDARMVFRGVGDVLESLDRVSADLGGIKEGLRPETMAEVGGRYAAFAEEVASALRQAGAAGPKRLSVAGRLGILLGGLTDRIRLKLRVPPRPRQA